MKISLTYKSRLSFLGPKQQKTPAKQHGCKWDFVWLASEMDEHLV